MKSVLNLLLVSISFYGSAQTVWIDQIGGTDSDEFFSIEVDAHGNSFVTGEIQAAVPFGSDILYSAGNSDAFLAKVDSNGNFLWKKRFGGPNEDFGRFVALDGQGNCYFVGRYSDTSIKIESVTLTGPDLTSKVFIAKFDTDGNLLWAKGLSPGFTDVFGFDVNKNGDALIYGLIIGEVDFEGTVISAEGTGAGGDLFALALRADGTVKWGRPLIIPLPINNIENGWPIAAALDDDGNAYLGGNISGTWQLDGHSVTTASGSSDIFVAKIDGQGVCQWLQSFPRTEVTPSMVVEFGDIIVDGDGSVYMTSTFFKTMKAGNLTLVTNPASVAATADIFLMKLNSQGETQWATSFGSREYDTSWNLVLDKFDNIYVAASGWSTINIGQLTITSNMNYPFFAEFAKNGDVVSADKVGETSINTTCMGLDPDGNILFAGGFLGTFKDQNPAFSLTNKSGTTDAFLLKYRTATPKTCNETVGDAGPVTGTGEVCPGNLVHLSVPPVENAVHYVWKAGSNVLSTDKPQLDAVLSAAGSATELDVQVSAVNACGGIGNASELFHVKFVTLNASEMLVPNVFTPNGDSLNQYFKLDDRLMDSHLKVINRWGEEVYSSDHYANEWNGANLATGVYFYFLRKECMSDIKGPLTILR